MRQSWNIGFILLFGCGAMPLVGDEVRAERIAFLVAELPGEVDHGDSFVITIDETDLARIEHARDLVAWIARGGDPLDEDAPDGRIVFSQLAAGANGINRDWLAVAKPEWSWHLEGEVEFVDNTIEIYDGWPGYIEEDVGRWIDNTDGAIGLWGYTVVQELGVVPEPSGSILAALGGAATLVGRGRKRRRCDEGLGSGQVQ